MFPFSGKETLKNLLNNERLLRMWKKFSIFQSVTKGRTAPQKRPVFHSLLVAPPHILGNGGAFLLSGHGQQGELHLSQHLGGIDALLLKNSDHAQVFQPARGFNQFQRIAGEAGNRLHQDPSPAAKEDFPAPPLPEAITIFLAMVFHFSFQALLQKCIAFLRQVHCAFAAREILVVDFCRDRRAVNASVPAFNDNPYRNFRVVYRSVSNHDCVIIILPLAVDFALHLGDGRDTAEVRRIYHREDI